MKSRTSFVVAAVMVAAMLTAFTVGISQAQSSAQVTSSSPQRAAFVMRGGYSSDSVYCRSVPIGSTTAVSDTTDGIDVPNLAGIPAGGPAGANIVLRLFFTSAKQPGDTPGNVYGQSPDSLYISSEGSLDGGISYVPIVAAAGMAFTNISSGPSVGSYVLPATATAVSGTLYTKIRFIVRAGDAAQVNGLRVWYTYPRAN